MNAAWMYGGTLLLSATLAGTAVALMAELLLRLVPRMPAAVRSAVWAGALFILILLPIFRVSSAGVDAAQTLREGRFVLGSAWLIAFAACWAMLSIVRAAQLIASARWMSAVLRGAAPAVLGPQSAALANGTDLARRVEVCVTSHVDVPCVAGFLRPRILLPLGLPESLPDADLCRVLQHELEHVRRWDEWMNLLQKCLLVLFPLHPGLWLVERRLCTERESACDERVVQTTGAPKAYATCLANLAERSVARRRIVLALAAWGRRSELAARVQRILHGQPLKWGTLRTAAAVSFFSVALLAGALCLARFQRLIAFADAAPTVAAINTPAPNTTFYVAKVVPANFIVMHAQQEKSLHAVRKEHVTQPSVHRSVVLGAPVAESNVTLVHMDDSAKAHAAPAVWVPEPGDDFAAIPVSGGWIIVRL